MGRIAAGIGEQPELTDGQHEIGHDRRVEGRIGVETGLRVVQPVRVVVEGPAAGMEHLMTEAGYVDDEGGVAQVVVLDQSIEQSVHGGQARAPTRRLVAPRIPACAVHDRFDAAVDCRLHVVAPRAALCGGHHTSAPHDRGSVRGSRTVE